MWDTLKASYDHVDVATQIHSQKRLITMQMREEDRVPDFLDQWQSVLDDTVSAGLAIPALQQVTLLLTALPSSCHSQSSSAGLTLLALLGKILQEDAVHHQHSMFQHPDGDQHLAMKISVTIKSRGSSRDG